VALELKRGKEVCSQPIHVSDSFQYIPKVLEKSKEDEEFLRRTLKSFILFQELSDEEIQTMIDTTERQEISKKTTLVKQDENDQYLQIIQKGKVDVYCERSQQLVGTLRSGDIFGEMALLYGEDAPNSFIVADDELTVVWRIDHHTFRYILAHSAHKRDSNIRSCLSNIPLFQSLSEQNLQKFADSLTRVAFQNGERIVTKGDEGSVFYLIEDGEVRVHDIGIGDGRAVDQLLSAGGKNSFV
jgi:cAMP-dependent protein kinase regulator